MSITLQRFKITYGNYVMVNYFFGDSLSLFLTCRPKTPHAVSTIVRLSGV